MSAPRCSLVDSGRRRLLMERRCLLNGLHSSPRFSPCFLTPRANANFNLHLSSAFGASAADHFFASHSPLSPHYFHSTSSTIASQANHPRAFSSSSSSSASSSSSSSSSASSSGSPSSSSVRSSSLGFMSRVSAEVKHVRDHYNKYNVPLVTRKVRVRPVVTRTYADMRDDVRGKKVSVVKTDASGKMTLEESEDAYSGPTALTVTDSETVWDKRIAAAKEWLRSSTPFRSARKAVRNIEETDNATLKPMVEKVKVIKQKAEEKIEDWRDYYETSQDPLFWRVRDLAEMVVGETEMGVALGELKRVDPNWSLQSFLDEMQSYFIPVVLEAMLVGDMILLKSVCQDQAATHVYTQWKENEAKKIYWDKRILNIRHLDLFQAKVDRDEPLLVITFQAQLVHLARCLVTDDVKEGSESEIKTVHYVWILKRDHSNPLFDYKIVSASNQKVYQLV